MADHDELDPFLAEIARELKRPVHLDARLDQRVMAALDPSVIPLPVRRERRPWYRRPVSLSVTPLGAMAAAAAFSGIVLIGSLRLGAFSPTADAPLAAAPSAAPLELRPVANVTAPLAEGMQYQQFIIMVPEAQSVSLVGDFNDWDADRTPMERVSDDGAWSVILPLRPGRYQFQYEIDGDRRMSDPSRAQTPSEFGSPNSILVIEGRE